MDTRLATTGLRAQPAQGLRFSHLRSLGSTPVALLPSPRGRRRAGAGAPRGPARALRLLGARGLACGPPVAAARRAAPPSGARPSAGTRAPVAVGSVWPPVPGRSHARIGKAGAENTPLRCPCVWRLRTAVPGKEGLVRCASPRQWVLTPRRRRQPETGGLLPHSALGLKPRSLHGVRVRAGSLNGTYRGRVGRRWSRTVSRLS